MENIKIVCVDMFQTLVDVNSRIPVIWRKILKKDYTEEKAYKYGIELEKEFMKQFYERCCEEGNSFHTIKFMFVNSFKEIFKRYKLEFQPREAAEIIIKEHGFSKPYDDTEQFFEIVNQLPVCLVSDADFEMIDPLLRKYRFDTVFISEQMKSYKSSPKSTIFKEVLKKYKVAPNQIIHIGDGYSDIYGARQVGLKTCWLNRKNKKWEYEDIKPDYTINSLIEISRIFNKVKEVV